MQRHIECPGVLGNLGLDCLSLFFRDLRTDRLVAPPSSDSTSLIGRLTHPRPSLPSRYSRRSAPRVFQAVTPDRSSGSTITVNTNPAVGDTPMIRMYPAR